MRYVAIFLIFVTLLVIGGFSFLWYGAHLEIQDVQVAAYPATEQLASYDSILRSLAEGSFIGELYQNTAMIMPESYAFLTYSVSLGNKGLFPAEWIQLRVIPDNADVLMLGEPKGYSLGSGKSGVISATVLSRAGAIQERQFVVSYYVLGRAFTVSFP